MDDLKEFISRRIKHATKRVTMMEERHGKNTSNYTYHGGQSLGYWQGLQSAYENILDKIEEMEQRS